MREHSVILNESEFELFQSIQRIHVHPSLKNDLLERLMEQVKNFYQFTAQTKTQNWLQIGDRTLFENIAPVKAEKNSPLASSIIVEQRKHLMYDEE
jgi:hypothetical protein